MTASFPLDKDRTLEQLLKHLAQFSLTAPGNCVVSVGTNIAVVVSPLNRALGTAKTAW
jgi:hypothetical protein